jgi:hypothetical protein
VEEPHDKIDNLSNNLPQDTPKRRVSRIDSHKNKQSSIYFDCDEEHDKIDLDTDLQK